MFGKTNQSGQSLVEVLVAAFILGLLAIALAGVSVLGTKTVLVSEQRTVAQAIANKKIELVKITPYVDVGYNDGSLPDGIFSPTETVLQNNQDYVVSISVELIDDPENGCLDAGDLCDGSTITEATADYKKVVISVKYPSADVVTKEVKVSAITVTGQAAALLNLVGCDPADITGSCGIGQLCCNQQCLPKCEPGTSPEGYKCSSDGCGYELDIINWQSTATCFNDFECASEITNKQCIEGSCQPLCATDSDCPNTPVQESCLNGFCEAPCTVNDECSQDKECVDGSCQLVGCIDNTYCDTGYNCVDFQCVPTNCAADNECPPAYECTDNACMPSPCNANNCPGDWSCVAGSCQPPQCNSNQICNNSASCVQDECQPATCTNHDQCQGDAVCNGGVCSDPPPPPCSGILQEEAGVCVNPSRDVVPLIVGTDCPAPISLPCLPAIGEVTITWLPVEGQNYCTPIATNSECTTSVTGVSWSDTNDDTFTNCGIPGGPVQNECAPLNPIECGTSDGGTTCSGGETCLEGRCFMDAPCGVGYTDHPTIAGACVKEWETIPLVACSVDSDCSSIIGSDAYCSSGGQCVTAGCQDDIKTYGDQCEVLGDQMCRNLICIPKKELDCSYCPPPEDRIQYCYGLDCPDCGGGVGTACTDRFELPSIVVKAQDEETGCSSLACPDAPSVCGNNIVQPGEACDGSTCPTGAACSSCACPTPACGNNVKEYGEVCDGTDKGDCPVACTTEVNVCSTCQTSSPEPLCNNLLLDSAAGELCDPSASPDGCQVGEYCGSDCATCFPIVGGSPLPASCGDGTIDSDEQCDYNAGPTGCATDDTCSDYDCQCYPGSPLP